MKRNADDRLRLTPPDAVRLSMDHPMVQLPEDQRTSKALAPTDATDADLFCWVNGYREAMGNLGARAKSHKARSRAMMYLSKFEKFPAPDEALATAEDVQNVPSGTRGGVYGDCDLSQAATIRTCRGDRR
jgi:hypothetical protein